MNASFVYISTTTSIEAGRIGEVLVAEKLAASVNIFDEVRSIYHWENEVHDKRESIVIAKTNTFRVDEVIKRVRSLHSYQCPCIVAWSLDAGEKNYLDWIGGETAR